MTSSLTSGSVTGRRNRTASGRRRSCECNTWLVLANDLHKVKHEEGEKEEQEEEARSSCRLFINLIVFPFPVSSFPCRRWPLSVLTQIFHPLSSPRADFQHAGRHETEKRNFPFMRKSSLPHPAKPLIGIHSVIEEVVMWFVSLDLSHKVKSDPNGFVCWLQSRGRARDPPRPSCRSLKRAAGFTAKAPELRFKEIHRRSTRCHGSSSLSAHVLHSFKSQMRLQNTVNLVNRCYGFSPF